MEKVHSNYQSISPFETDGQREDSHSPKKLGLYTLCILAFYSVNGGAFGIEDIVRAGMIYVMRSIITAAPVTAYQPKS